LVAQGQHRQHISLDIAGFTVALHTDDSAAARRIRERYGAFLTTGRPSQLSISLKITPGALFIQAGPGPWVIESSYGRERLTFRSFTERGEVDLHNGQGWLEMDPSAHVENFLRVVYAWLCLQNGALLLHASGVIREGRGYVFFGPSGAGKSTISELAAATGDVVSDDLVIIRWQPGGCTLHGVPFKGQFSDAPRANQSAPLQGLYRLRQDTGHFLQPLSPGKAVAELVAAAPFVVAEPGLAEQLIAICSRVAGTTLVRQLHFTRDDGFWKVIDGFEQRVPASASPDGRAGY
jgi:hypothetical protein